MSISEGSAASVSIFTVATISAAWAALILGVQDAPKSEPKTPEAARPGPTDAEARVLLRRALDAAVAIGPDPPLSRLLTSLATAQAKAGDLDGARATFAHAATDAMSHKNRGGWDIWRIGHGQVEAGDPRGALRTLGEAVNLAEEPGLNPMGGPIELLNNVIQDQIRAGDPNAAKVSLARLKAIRSKQNPKGDQFEQVEYPAALVAAGEVDEAFSEVDSILSLTPGSSQSAAAALGRMAVATLALDRVTAGPIVDRIAKRLALFRLFAEEEMSVLHDLARAFARVGRVDEARAMASRIGLGPKRGRDDATSAQPYALLLVANEQDEAGDRSGAKATLRMAVDNIVANPKMQGRDGRCMQVAARAAIGGDIDAARLLLAQMKADFRHDVFEAIGLAELARGDAKAARAEFDLALAAVREEMRGEIGPQAQRGRVQIAKLRAMTGDLPAAEATLVELGRTKDALRLAIAMEGYHQVAIARASIGDLAGAVEFALAVESPEMRRKALEGVAEGYLYWKVIKRR